MGLAELHLAERPAFGLVGQIGERRQAVEFVDQFDDRAVLRVFVRDAVHHAIGRDHDAGNPRSTRERPSVMIERADVRYGVIVKAVGLVIGDDDGALLPIGARRDRVDLVGDEGLRDLRVRISRDDRHCRRNLLRTAGLGSSGTRPSILS